MLWAQPLVKEKVKEKLSEGDILNFWSTFIIKRNITLREASRIYYQLDVDYLNYFISQFSK